MRDEAAAMIDRLEADNDGLTSIVDDAWAVLNEADVDVQMVDTLADAVGKLVKERDQLIKDRDAPALAARRALVDGVGYFLADLDGSDD